MRTEERLRRTRRGWRGLARACGVIVFLLLAGTAMVLTDIEAAGFAVATLVFVVLLSYRRGTLGLALLGLQFANVAFWMGTGALDNLRHGQGSWQTAVPAALAIASVTGLVGVAGSLLGRGDRAARPVATAAALAFAAATIAGVATTNGAGEARAGEISLETKGMAYSDTELEAQAGEIAVAVSNGDLFWHTFTVPALGVNVNLPVGAERRTVFAAEAGTYEFICTIGPHASLGMKGTLTVR